MAKTKTQYVCTACGHVEIKWMGRCPGCGEWNTLIEETVATTRSGPVTGTRMQPMPIESIPPQTEQRVRTGLTECDFVLGGGIVPGSLVLIGGDPGIGKSTLLLQLSQSIASQNKRVLYVSGEESASQIRLRAERLGTVHKELYVLAETDLDLVVESAAALKPDFLIIDSIQTVFRPSLTSAPGSVAQVRECTGVLLRLAKQQNIATFIVGHVTKDGAIAGPRMLEHMVDAVLYFEGERHHMYRVLRAVKNRFGSTNELAVFEMHDDGLREVSNPSLLFLSERQTVVPGSAVVAAMEGRRPLLLEVQALVAPTGFATPRRMSTGADHSRVSMLLAVLERRIGLQVQASDAYVNVAGGVRVDEPAVDLGIALALVSSHRDRPLARGDLYIGEVGLTGEVRTVTRLSERLREAQKLGFARCFVPAGQSLAETFSGLEVIQVKSLQDAIQLAF
ncbi:DNA repair protein RadA [Alicyclobacillus fastidiosus]|uniref:DNA repair protein RadA n=1 Tax=Alicyclobacillus fastidiosus TaxID=392011 RepID=A0ABV5AIS3_9BACL|nr:DNA repair protein RadA [Alicyclobacillus fastidiosus]WEH09966.1 DNA repair protein RadA [Alicyclobacillus fastidiosus]